MKYRVGLIDVGTNTLRLVVPQDANEPFQKVIATRLGQGLSKSGRLSNAAISRTKESLQELMALARKQGAERTEAYATAWARQAVNTDEMLSAAAEIDLPIWILSEQEEAEMAFEAVKLMRPSADDFTVVDIGGGSTEIIGSNGGRITRSRSIPYGAVNFTEQFLPDDPPIHNLPNAEQKGGEIFADVPRDDCRSLIALGGTAAALVGLSTHCLPTDLQFFKKAQGLSLSRESISDWLVHLSGLPLAERKNIEGMEAERADILVGGIILLKALMERLKSEQVAICLYSFIHGLLACRLRCGSA